MNESNLLIFAYNSDRRVYCLRNPCKKIMSWKYKSNTC